MAYNFKWPKTEIMGLTRSERNEWIEEISGIMALNESVSNATFERQMQRVAELANGQGGAGKNGK